MSLTTTPQYNRQYNKLNSQFNEQNSSNSHRRYVLEPPIHSTTIRNSIHHQKQTKGPNYSENGNTDIVFLTSPLKTNNTTKYFGPDLNKSSYDDPWVKALLERDIDFSKLDQQEAQVQFLPISNIRLYQNESKIILQDFYHHNQNNEENFKIKMKDSYQYPLTSSSQTNRPFRKWIIESPNNLTINSNHFPINRNKFNSRKLQKTKTNEEQSLTEQQKKS
ncbi:unnamed protein product, partial [Rotaria sordida]